MAPSPRVSLGRDQHMLAERGQMMTTDRTTIRRRLAIGRSAYGPPWSIGKARHRNIVAPLIATVAASLAVGAGVSIAKLTRERRSKRDRRLGLRPGEPWGKELQRMALGQLDLALEALGRGEEIPDERAVHETRKALKRLRALLRLLRPQLGAGTYDRESAALRDAGRALSGARDAEVMLATFDALIEHNRDKLAGRGGVIRLRGALLAERSRARRGALGDPRVRTQVLAELHACRVRIAMWQLPDYADSELVEAGLLHLYRQGRKRWRRARSGRGDRTRLMHQWRKRAKDLRYALEMLQPTETPRRETPKGKRARRRLAAARKDVKWLRREAKRADKLGELLGEDHDLAMLAQWIAADREGILRGRARKLVLKLIARRRRKLRMRTLHQGERLFAAHPKELMRRIRGAHTPIS
jgi:CHAD domain-containing protein